MAKKKYIAKSHISLSVRVSQKTSAHISFSALTGGGSVFYTDDENLQQALEAHPKFGKLFKLDDTFVEKPATKKVAPTSKVAPANEENTDNANSEEAEDNEPTTDVEQDEDTEAQPEEESAEEATGLTKVPVTCLDDAKEYLSEKFGISRTKIRSKKAIEEAAAENGIEFVGI